MSRGLADMLRAEGFRPHEIDLMYRQHNRPADVVSAGLYESRIASAISMSLAKEEHRGVKRMEDKEE